MLVEQKFTQALVNLSEALTLNSDQPLKEIAQNIFDLRQAEVEENREIERKIKHYQTRCLGFLGTKHSNAAAGIAFLAAVIIDLLESIIAAMEGLENTELVQNKSLNLTLGILQIVFAVLTFFFFVVAAFVFCCGMEARDRIQQLKKIEFTRQEKADLKRLLQFLEEYIKLDQSKKKENIKESMRKLDECLMVLPVEVCGERIFRSKEALLPAVLLNLNENHPMRKKMEEILRPPPPPSNSSLSVTSDASTGAVARTILEEFRSGTHTQKPLEGGLDEPKQRAWKVLEKTLGREIPSMEVCGRKLYRNPAELV